MSSAVLVSLRIAASPARVFEAFTQEIDQWWRPSALFQIGAGGDGTLRFEPGENGRLVTVFPDGEQFEIGRITAWRPGERLAFTWRQASFAPEQCTHVEVSFAPLGAETRVTVEHRGWDGVPAEHVARHGFPERVFLLRQGEHWRALLAALSEQI